MYVSSRPRWAVSAACLVLVISGCGGETLRSEPPPAGIRIDGDPSEWAGRMVSEKKPEGSLGVANDGRYLYLCLASTDPTVPRRILGSGLTVWFDPKGGGDHVLGIRYPVGLAGERGGPPPGDAAGDAPEGFGGYGGSPADSGDTHRERVRRRMEDMMEALEVVTADGPLRQTVEGAAAEGILARAGWIDSTFVYELRVPLARSGAIPFAVGAEPGTTIGLGLETAAPRHPRFGGMRPGGGEGDEGPEGGAGGFGGGRRGGFGGGRRGGAGGPGRFGRGPAEPIKLWLKVALAPGDTSAVPR